VKAGDQILTLEAMKMNTIIYAPASGTLTAFCVNPGDTVQEGQALAKIGLIPAAAARKRQQSRAPAQIINRYNNIPYESF